MQGLLRGAGQGAEPSEDGPRAKALPGAQEQVSVLLFGSGDGRDRAEQGASGRPWGGQ